MNSKLEKSLGTLSLIPLACSFGLGFLKEQNAVEQTIHSIIPNATNIENLDNDIYKVETNEKTQYVSLASHAGYAGPMQLGIVTENKHITSVAIIKSPDTKPYLDKIFANKLPDAYIGQSIDNIDAPDAVSGATISSNAIMQSVQKASDNLIQNEAVRNSLGSEISTNTIIEKETTKPKLATNEMLKCAIFIALFLFALFISSKKCTFNKKKAHYALGAISFVTVGILYSSQFSLSTIALFFSGTWLNGIASFAPLFALICAILVLVFTKKNLYCAHICPFGALQEGISLITNCSAPKRKPFFIWTNRFFTLALLCFALYFASPSYASYEPFGKTFNMIGTFTLFALSISIILSSLIFKKPWCNLFCPMTAFFDYIQFWRSMLTPKKRG